MPKFCFVTLLNGCNNPNQTDKATFSFADCLTQTTWSYEWENGDSLDFLPFRRQTDNFPHEVDPSFFTIELLRNKDRWICELPFPPAVVEARSKLQEAKDPKMSLFLRKGDSLLISIDREIPFSLEKSAWFVESFYLPDPNTYAFYPNITGNENENRSWLKIRWRQKDLMSAHQDQESEIIGVWTRVLRLTLDLVCIVIEYAQMGFRFQSVKRTPFYLGNE